MTIIAGILGAVFGAFHLAGSPSLSLPEAPRGSGDPGAIPKWARLAWRGTSLATLVTAVAVGLSGHLFAVVAMAFAMFSLADLALLNGIFMKGKPTISHHLVRYGIGSVIILIAVLGI